MASLSLHMFDISSQHSEWKKWIHQFEDCISIVICVDLNQYDEFLKGSNNTRLTESLFIFESAVNSHWFRRASIVLLLCNVGHFKEKLRSEPLSNYFPDYSSGDDFSRAWEYLLWRFDRLNRAHLNIYTCFCEPSDGSNMRNFVWSAVKDTMFRNANKASGIH